jgi:PAS domain S-box-containing protein
MEFQVGPEKPGRVDGLGVGPKTAGRLDPLRVSPPALRRIALLVGALLLLVVFAALLYSDFERDRDNEFWVTRTDQVQGQVREVTSALERAEAEERGYLLTGDPAYLEAYDSALHATYSARRSLRRLTADNSDQQRRLDELDRLMEAGISRLQQTAAMRQTEGFEAARRMVGIGEDMMEDGRRILRAVDDTERALLTRRSQAAVARAMRIRWGLGLGSGALLILFVLAGVVIERDFRKRESQQREVQNSEERLRLALDAAGAGTWEWDLETNQNVWSEPLWKLYGIEPHSCEPSYESWRRLLHPDDREMAEQVVGQAAHARTELNVEFRVSAPDGSQRWLLARARPLWSENGRAPCYTGIALDITQRKLAEEALRERELILRRFTEVAPVAIAIFDRDMRYLAVSERFRGDFQLGTQELLGRSHYEIFPEISEEWRDVHRRCLAGAVERSAGEAFRRADGSEQWVRWEIQPWRQAGGEISGLVLFTEDITRQLRSEQAVRESEARLRLAQQVARVGTFEWNLQTGSSTWTPELEVMYGLSPGEFLERSQAWESLIHPEDRPEVVRQLEHAMQTGKFDTEWRVVRPDGEMRWLSGRAWVFKDDSGKPLRLIGVNIDITEDKQKEEALRQSQAELQAALASMTDAVSIGDNQGRFIGVNDAYATFYKFKSKEACLPTLAEYSNVLDVSFPDGSPAPLEMWATSRALRGEMVTNAEYLLRRKDSGESWVGSYSFGPIRNKAGAIVGSVVVARDITGHRRAQEELRASEERFRKVFENAPTGIAITSWDMHVERCNPAFCNLLGYREEELRGTWFGSLIPEEDRPASMAAAERLRTGKVSSFEREGHYIRKDGEPVWLHRFVSVLPNENGGKPQLVALVTDIHERKRAEEEIRELNSDLERRVRERTSQLEAANHELEAFAYSVSHDLRAPLRGIDGWSLALVEEYSGQLDEQAHKYLNRVRSETQRMGLLIDNLLQLSRITRSEMNRGAVDLTSLAHTVAARLQEEHAGRRIEFIIAPGLQAAGDAALLGVALTNLLGNAVKFTGPRDRARIEFGQVDDPTERIFYVRDNGVGFEMAFASMLFGPFQRLHKASEFPGTGIGLATVERVIHRHGGRVWAEAEVGRGATFHFTIGTA